MCNAISGRGNQKLIRQASGKPGDPKAYDGIIVRTEGTWSLNGRRGTYRFNHSTGWLETGEGEVLSRFQCQRIQERPLELPVNSYSKMGNLKILSSEIMTLEFFWRYLQLYQLSCLQEVFLTGNFLFNRWLQVLDVQILILIHMFEIDVLTDPQNSGWERLEDGMPQPLHTALRTEIQKKENAGALFVLPAQLNGAEYPSHLHVVKHVEEYKSDNTGGIGSVWTITRINQNFGQHGHIAILERSWKKVSYVWLKDQQ